MKRVQNTSKKVLAAATAEEIAAAQEVNRRREEWKKEKKDGERRCSACGSSFHPRRHWQVYCSPPCRVAAFQNRALHSEKKILTTVEDLEKQLTRLKEKLKELESAHNSDK